MAVQRRRVSQRHRNIDPSMSERWFSIDHLPFGKKRKNEPPSYITVDEYLQHVVDERKKCYETLTFTELKEEANVKNTSSKEIFVFPVQLKKEYLSEFLNVGTELRARMPELKERLLLSDKDHLPGEGDMLSWCAFCLGVNAMSKVEKSSYVKEKKEESNFEPGGFPPFLRLILNLSKQNVNELLFFLCIWLKNLGFTSRQGQWIYALLSIIEKPPSKMLENALHALFITCSNLREKRRHRNTDTLVSLNVFIYILQEHFGCKVEKKDLNVHDKRFFFEDVIETDLTGSEDESESSEPEDEIN